MEIDNKLYQESKSNKSLVFKDYRWKIVLINNGLIRFKRRIYYNKQTKKYIYLLDQFLNFKKWTNYDSDFLKKLESMFYDSQIGFSKIQKLFQIDNINYSKTNYWRIVHSLSGFDLSPKFNINNPSEYKYLYINIDDTYLNTIKSHKFTKRCFRVICCHQGKDENNNLINKYLLTINIANKSKEEFIEYLKEKIEFNLWWFKTI